MNPIEKLSPIDLEWITILVDLIRRPRQTAKPGSKAKYSWSIRVGFSTSGVAVASIPVFAHCILGIDISTPVSAARRSMQF